MKQARQRILGTKLNTSALVPFVPKSFRKALTTRENPDYLAYIDEFGAGMVRGWAAYVPDGMRRLKVRIYLDDALVADGLAEDVREDLKKIGHGDGGHGYQFAIPKKALFCAEVITLAIVTDDGEIVGVRKILRAGGQGSSPSLYMDASDLIEFLTHHRELSGIQRVQAGYLLGLGKATIGDKQVRICTRFKNSSFYFDMSYEQFAAMLRSAGDLSGVPLSGWKRHMQAFKQSLTTRTTLRQGDILFTMGAPWALDDHNETIRCAKFFYGVRYVQIFYDLIPISVPEVVAAPLIPHFARAMAAMSIYADHVFSISRYSMEDLADTLRGLGRPVPEISVIPMGGTITDAEAPGVRNVGALAKLGVTAPFVLCVGTLEPRKNHTLLFQVWRKLVAKHGAANVPKLVLVGRVGWYMEDFMRILKVSDFVDKTIVHLQGVSNDELSELYDSCLFTIFPSVSEGWGLPITESLARGKVCVCSDVTSMPEAGGAHALYIDPLDTSQAYRLCDQLITDGESLARHEAELRRSFKAPTWDEASQGLKAQFATLIRRLDATPAKPARKPIDLGRTYKFYNIEASQPDATSTEVFRNFLDQEDALDLLAGWSWYDVDVPCTWACGPAAALNLRLPEGSGDEFIVYLGLMIPSDYASVPFEVWLDGAARGRVTARDGAYSISLAITAEGSREHAVTLRFSGDRVAPEDRRRASGDRRLLGIGIASVAVFAEEDYKGRLEFFEARALEAV